MNNPNNLKHTKMFDGFHNSPNHFNGRGSWKNKADVLVAHVTESSNRDGSLAWFMNAASQTSTHFIVGTNGRYVQCVDFANGAYGNGNAAATVGTSTSALIRSRNNFVNSRDNANMYSFSFELSGYSYKKTYDAAGNLVNDFGVPCEAQFQGFLEACKNVVDYILTYNPNWRATRDNCVGHCDIRPASKPNCPSANHGERWPFARWIAELNKYIDDKKGNTTAPVDVKPPLTNQIIDVVANAGFTVGTKVVVKKGAKTYTGQAVSSWVYGASHPVHSYSGERVVLGGIMTPFNYRDLELETPAPVVKKKEVGAFVKIKAGATWWASTKPLAAWILASTYIIDELNGDRAVLSKKGINSPIDIKYLDVV
jgi:N-acetyl-anhydromuramyl-L-alanine amidase AmpD